MSSTTFLLAAAQTAADRLCNSDDTDVKNSLAPIPACADHDTLTMARDSLVNAQAKLSAISVAAQNWAVSNRLDEIVALLNEEIAGLACLAERCAEQEEIERRDWRSIAWSSYHDAGRD